MSTCVLRRAKEEAWVQRGIRNITIGRSCSKYQRRGRCLCLLFKASFNVTMALMWPLSAMGKRAISFLPLLYSRKHALNVGFALIIPLIVAGFVVQECIFQKKIVTPYIFLENMKKIKQCYCHCPKEANPMQTGIRKSIYSRKDTLMHVRSSVTRRTGVQNKKVCTTIIWSIPFSICVELYYHDTNEPMFSMPLFFSSK